MPSCARFPWSYRVSLSGSLQLRSLCIVRLITPDSASQTELAITRGPAISSWCSVTVYSHFNLVGAARSVMGLFEPSGFECDFPNNYFYLWLLSSKVKKRMSLRFGLTKLQLLSILSTLMSLQMHRIFFFHCWTQKAIIKMSTLMLSIQREVALLFSLFEIILHKCTCEQAACSILGGFVPPTGLHWLCSSSLSFTFFNIKCPCLAAILGLRYCRSFILGSAPLVLMAPCLVKVRRSS